MTDFAAELRHRCRNPRCRSKLKAPVENPHHAFCSRGCHAGFYRSRCLVCEGAITRKTERQLFCRKPRCRSAFRGSESHYRYPGSPSAGSPLKTSIKPGVKTPLKPDRAWAPDGPGCRWDGGEYARLEKRNRTALEAHFDRLDAEYVARDYARLAHA